MKIHPLDLDSVPESEWYELTLECGHVQYVRVRLTNQEPTDQHFTLCLFCKQDKSKVTTTKWTPVINVRTANSEFVSNVSSGFAFVLPRDILRLRSSGGTGNPRPYAPATPRAKFRER